MYTGGAQTAGQHRRHHHIDTSSPCLCQHCVHYQQPAHGDHGGPGCQPSSAGQTDHPSLDFRRDFQAPWAKDVGGRTFAADRVERGGHRSPQRRPMFAGLGLYGQSDDLSQACLWELYPAQWSYPLEPGVRHFLNVREQCGCVVYGNTRAHPLNTGIPHPLPHLQGKGQGHRLKRTVRYVSVDGEGEGCRRTPENYHFESHKPCDGHLRVPNGHCGPVVSEIEEGRDRHQDRGRVKGGSEEGCNGRVGSHKGFFPTEVQHKHFSQSRQKGSRVPASGISGPEPPKSTSNDDRQREGLEAVKQRRRQDLVRDQIRQVVTELEDVLGGLKQVHVEMKEVVEQIDRLTAGIDLSDEMPCVTQGSSSDFRGSVNPGDLRFAPLPNHKLAPLQASQQTGDDCIILRTNSPSPVHMASVVKTSCFTPTNHSKEIGHERPGVNGRPPHLYPFRNPNHTGQSHPEPQSQGLEPVAVTGNSTSNPRTQKPPLCRENGRCGKSSHLPPKPVRTPAISSRGRQNTSMV